MQLVFNYKKLVLFVVLAIQFGSCSKVELINANKAMWITPEISSILPSEVPVTGGTLITIIGSGFFDGVSVTIGGVPCNNVTVISLTKLTCVTPQSGLGGDGLGAASVVVTNPVNKKESGTSPNFSFISAVSATPGFSVVSGGNTATGTGIRSIATIGESLQVQGGVQTGTGVSAFSGLQSVIFDPNNPN